MRVSAPPELLAAFDEHDRDARLRYSKVVLALSIVLVPAGTSLDWFVYPHRLTEFLLVRLGVAGVAAIALALHYTPFAPRHIRWFGMFVPLLINAAISWMILRSEGAASPYYAGMNLALLGIAVLVPWSFGEAVVACGMTVAFYFAACVVHGSVLEQRSIFYNNVYFLVLTSVICATSAYFKRRSRFEEFRLSSELARSYRQLSELERLKTEFFANVSHELRTPLTLILSPLQDILIQKQELPDSVRELAELARDNSLRLLKLINDLLEVVRLESGEFRFQAEPLELGHFVASQAESVRPLARLKGLELKVERASMPLWVSADPAQLEKLLVNLFTNAIKFTSKAGTVAVAARQEDSIAVVEVRDTGIGIAEAELPHIFDRFRQADGSATRRFSGVGIGLSLAKELAEKHRGRLTVTSRLGEGSIFTLELPLEEPASGTDAAVARSRPADTLSDTRTGDGEDSLGALLQMADRSVPIERGADQADAPVPAARADVLVIDDEPDMRRYLASILADQYSVLQASDGVSGLELARTARPKLVLVDLMMPGMDGWQVCAALKRTSPEPAPKVVVVTARTDEMAKIAALKRGADDFLGKPFSTLEVRTRLTNLNRTYDLENSLREQNQALREAMEKLRAAEAQLVQREKMKAIVRLAGGILHEINNPLNFTLTAVGIALEQCRPEDSQLREILEDIQAGMLRIRDIVADLRAFASPGAADLHERFDVNELVGRALRFTAKELADVHLECQIPTECPTYGSKSQLLQVLTNLLLNASAAVRQVAPERDPTIRITAQTAGQRTRVGVWDNGTGIPPDLLDKVFDPFLSTRDVGQGIGLGLSICHALITAHGGEIAVRSQQGSWTEVAFELPLRRTETFA
jgi:signal transduction histidine kinase